LDANEHIPDLPFYLFDCRNSVMAPIHTALGAWGAAGLPGATVFSLIALFILTITVLALCSRCQKHSFDLQQDAPVDRASTLVRIVQLENVAVDNPDAANITRDEKRDINGITNQRPNNNPAVTETPVMEISLRTVDQTVPTYTTHTLSTFKPPNSQTTSTEDQMEQADRDSSSTLEVHRSDRHVYEFVGELSPIPDQSEMSLNPYAMYESIKTNRSQGNGSALPAPTTLTEELEEVRGSTNINDTYATIGREIKRSSPPLEEPADNMEED
ncbi:hypothetical protein NFI96_018855, partial [Prochilodus magdalenae]